MEPLKDGDAEGLERDEDGRLIPTKETGTSLRFEYKLKRPMVVDRLFALEKTDHAPGPRAKEPGAWKRGDGCARLNLPMAGHKKGRTATSVSMVAGSAAVHFIVPKKDKSWPRLTMRFLCLTADRNLNISWPANFTSMAKTLLRKLVKQKLEAMLKDDRYPTHPSMTAASLQGSGSGDSILALTGPIEPWIRPPPRPPVLALPPPQ